MLLAGCQIDHTNFHKQYHQGHQAIQGVNTVLPFLLEIEPFTEEAIWVFLTGRIAVNGRDFSVDLTNRRITWLSTAPYGIDVSDWLEINYFSKL
jgi:hypothetical protein